MTASDEHAIGVFERKILRAIAGPKKIGEVYMQRSNNELYQCFKEADIVKRIKISRLRWAGHVVRRPAEAPLSRVLSANFVDGKRSRGRPKNSWIEAVERDCIAFGIRNWQAVAKDRASYRRALREAMDQN
jgi:hypothetical protein